MRVVGAERHHAKIVAKEIKRMMVGREFRESLEERTVLRSFDMGFDGEHALCLREFENRVHQTEQFEIVVL